MPCLSPTHAVRLSLRFQLMRCQSCVNWLTGCSLCNLLFGLQVKVAFRQLVAPSLDSKGRYLVGAAVGTRQEDRRRVAELVSLAEVDIVIVDSSQGTQYHNILLHPTFQRTGRLCCFSTCSTVTLGASCMLQPQLFCESSLQ